MRAQRGRVGSQEPVAAQEQAVRLETERVKAARESESQAAQRGSIRPRHTRELPGCTLSTTDRAPTRPVKASGREARAAAGARLKSAEHHMLRRCRFLSKECQVGSLIVTSHSRCFRKISSHIRELMAIPNSKLLANSPQTLWEAQARAPTTTLVQSTTGSGH
jgi:hypothetical protein